jgi:hypothetical protein
VSFIPLVCVDTVFVYEQCVIVICKVGKYQLTAAVQILLPIFEFRRSTIWLRIDMLKICRVKATDFCVGIY